MSEIEGKIKALALGRKAVADYKAEIKLLEETQANSQLGRQIKTLKELLTMASRETSEAEETVRSLAVEIYTATNDKQPHPAVKVILQTALAYEEEAALNYSREHLPQALKLNRAAFEKAAKVLDLDFVEVGLQPAARIDSDLSAYP